MSGNMSVSWKQTFMTQSDYTIVSKWNQSDPKSLSYTKNDPKITRPTPLHVAPGLLMALLTPQEVS